MWPWHFTVLTLHMRMLQLQQWRNGIYHWTLSIQCHHICGSHCRFQQWGSKGWKVEHDHWATSWLIRLQSQGFYWKSSLLLTVQKLGIQVIIELTGVEGSSAEASISCSNILQVQNSVVEIELNEVLQALKCHNADIFLSNVERNEGLNGDPYVLIDTDCHIRLDKTLCWMMIPLRHWSEARKSHYCCEQQHSWQQIW